MISEQPDQALRWTKSDCLLTSDHCSLLPFTVPEDSTIQVHFDRPMPLFPLDSATLLPQQMLLLNIFEPRYRQMIATTLDGFGQFAMAIFSGTAWKQNYHGRPMIRPAVCIGQILQHESLPDGRYNLLLQGLCRARVVYELPASGEKLYREAILEHIGDVGGEPLSLQPARDTLDELLSQTSLRELRASRAVLEHVRNEDMSTSEVLDRVSFTMLSDKELRYRLLAEGDPAQRASLIFRELRTMQTVIDRAGLQHAGEWPKGCSWN